MPIPLLNFPSDLLRDVFKECDPFDLYKLSKCSERTRKSIMAYSANNWKIKSSDTEISVVCRDSRYHFINTMSAMFHEYETFYPLYVPRPEVSEGMFIKYPNGGFTELFVYLLDTFRIKTVNAMRITNENMPSSDFLDVVKIVIGRNLDVERLYFGTRRNYQEIVKLMELVNQTNPTKAFFCGQSFPPNFQHHFTRFPERITVCNSHWFQLDQLISCSSSHIFLKNSKLTNQDLDLLLQKWKKNEALPSLQFLDTYSNCINNQSPILGMYPSINWNGHRDIFFQDGDIEKRLVNPVRITKDDGTVGWLRVDLGESSEIEFLVVNSSSTAREVIYQYPDSDDEDEIDEPADPNPRIQL
ncbi:unnamed protein product [Caenorhabditis nigoni]